MVRVRRESLRLPLSTSGCEPRGAVHILCRGRSVARVVFCDDAVLT